ncbi:TetR/AcrR family transcriptional regulator [Sciscionella sediminilitoris]|uniref:TetR/AcrR family transcriptional regulator n=1 Tax=Sciscionella sediminilitoris TaxID=1445613 RepID=UPI0004DFA070|nr:TetR/AcrR family transcriptional regulator C-terminal domain-containing protein [Sciscionella sp. SE31]
MPRPSTPLLSGAVIKAKALEILDSEGLEGLTMRRIATALGVRAASLYGHVATKDELLDSLVDDLAARVDIADALRQRDWVGGLRAWARSYRALLAEHPNLVPFLARGPRSRPASLRQADAIHGALLAAGWPPRYATMVGASVSYLVIGAAMTQYSGGFSEGFSDDVRVYLDRYPNLYDAHRLHAHAAEIDGESFEVALEAALDGFRALFERLKSG